MILEYKTHTHTIHCSLFCCMSCINYMLKVHMKFSLFKTTISPVTASTYHEPVLNKAICYGCVISVLNTPGAS